jgi:hypothetical protein
MGRILSECLLERPDLTSAATTHVQRGQLFRERTRDQKGRWTLATIWIDKNEPDVLRVRTKRTIDCPDCDGTGIRKDVPLGVRKRMSIDFRCLKCDGKGTLENYVEERRFILAEGDLERRGLLPGARPRSEKIFPDERLSDEEKAQIEKMVSDNPELRLSALEWLDKNYVEEGIFFHRLSPMLRKARWIAPDDEKKVTVYQFWAGKEKFPDRAYYRIYVDKIKGKVIHKGFVSMEGILENRDPTTTERIQEKAEGIKNWFTEGWTNER